MNFFKVLMISSSLLSYGSAMDHGNNVEPLTVEQINGMTDPQLKEIPNLWKRWRKNPVTRSKEYLAAQQRVSTVISAQLQKKRAEHDNPNPHGDAIEQGNQALIEAAVAENAGIEAMGKVLTIDDALEGIRGILQKMADTIPATQALNQQITARIEQLSILLQQANQLTAEKRTDLNDLVGQLERIRAQNDTTQQDYEALQALLNRVR